MDWIDVALGKDMWRAVLYTVMNFPILLSVRNFLTDL